MSSAFIFGLLIALMLTGMPVSIALGLTVLTFLYVMTDVPIEAVALKLFTGIESFGIMACALFAAVSGSSPATVVAIGSLVLPAMVAQGFPRRFGAGVITTSGALGILIPPSIAMVLYAVSTNASIGKLFIAGIVPGLMLATMLGITTWYRAYQNDYPRVK